MKKISKKLGLSRETIRNLDRADLLKVAGALSAGNLGCESQNLTYCNCPSVNRCPSLDALKCPKF